MGKDRKKSSGVPIDVLQQVVDCGRYQSVEEVLDCLDEKIPLGNGPDFIVKLNRIAFLNDEIDRGLFEMVSKTSAWTWLEDYRVLFILEGPKGRGTIIHERMRRCVHFRLAYRVEEGVTLFMSFPGDRRKDRFTKDGKPKMTLFQLLAGKMKGSVTEARNTFELLIRTCDDIGWIHTEFPFIHPARKLDLQHKLLEQHEFLIHQPHQVTHP